MHKELLEFVAIGVGVVSDDLQNLGDESASGSALDVDEQVERVGDVAFDGAIRQLTLLCSTQVVKRLSACRAELAWTVESVPECPVLRSCSKSNASAPANLSQDDAIGPVAEARLESSRMVTAGSPSGDSASKRTRFGVLIWISAVSSMTRMRSSAGMKLARMFSRVVLPVPVPPEMRMFWRFRAPLSRMAASSWVRVPMRMRSSIPKCVALNLRIVSVTPCKLQGGMTAATRQPSGRRESRIGFSSEISLPSRRAIFLTATTRDFGLRVTLGSASRSPGALDEDVLGAVDHDLADLRVENEGLDRPQKRQDHFEASRS